MIAVIQRVTAARVVVSGQTVGEIQRGLCVLASITKEDTNDDLKWMLSKLLTLRVFPSIDATKAFDRAMPPADAKPMFERFVRLAREMTTIPVATGEFGADMSVQIENDGPVTLVLDSKSRA